MFVIVSLFSSLFISSRLHLYLKIYQCFSLSFLSIFFFRMSISIHYYFNFSFSLYPLSIYSLVFFPFRPLSFLCFFLSFCLFLSFFSISFEAVIDVRKLTFICLAKNAGSRHRVFLQRHYFLVLASLLPLFSHFRVCTTYYAFLPQPLQMGSFFLAATLQ